MTPELKPCPACGGIAIGNTGSKYEDDPSKVCFDCAVTGPRDDADGAKWNALPRRDAHSNDGARLRKLREWAVQQDYSYQHGSDIKKEIDKLLSEPEPPAAVQVPEDVRKAAEWWLADSNIGPPKGLPISGVEFSRWILSLPTAPAPHDAEVERLRLPNELDERTASLVRRFAMALALKLLKAQEDYGYTDDWANKSDWMPAGCQQALVEHVEKGDPLDVAAYCAFLWHHGEPTAMPEPDDDVNESEELSAENGRLRTALQVLTEMVARQGGGK
jgi:hypothetical protein